MSELRCPYCGGEIDELTVICRHCKKNVRKARPATEQVAAATGQASGQTQRRALVWLVLVVLGLAVVVVIWGSSGGGSSSSRHTAMPRPGLQGAIEAALGGEERDVSRLSEFANSSSETGRVYVKFAVSDHFSEDSRVSSAQLDCTNILKAIAQSDVSYGNVLIVGTFPTKDVYGNVEETEVLRLDFDAATVQKINWANFSYRDIYAVADKAVVHPQLKP